MNAKSNAFSCNRCFTQKGLVFDDNITFHNRNLLIGRNGAGKTRFLKALEEYYKENNTKTSVVTLYFPENHMNADEVIHTSLYDAIYEKDSLSFQDFLRLASKDWLALIDDIYTGMSMRAAKTAQRMQEDFDRLNKKFLIFFDSELCPKDESSTIYMVKHTNGAERKIPVEQAIKEFSPGELMLFYLCILVFYLDHLSDTSIILILDEPEIHLHPKAQSLLCEFLYHVSKTHRQLFVETHSDHIFNGLRVGVANGTIENINISVNFFAMNEHYQTQCNPIIFGEYGKVIGTNDAMDINDLFDQFDIDLDRMLGL